MWERGGGVTGGIASPFLPSVKEGGEWSASCSSCFTPEETARDTHCTGGWVDPRESVDAVKKRKIIPLLGIDFQPSSL
jgi:hypothetical protein